MKTIQGKKAHFGNHTFEATADVIDGEAVTRLTVLKNYTNKYEATYFFNTKKQLVNLSDDKDCAMQFYSGSLSGTHYERTKGTRIDKNGREVETTILEKIPKIDYFLSCFKHNLN